MRFREALEIAGAPRPAGAELRRYALGCSCTPVHLQSFLQAHLMMRFPTANVEFETIPYGDLTGGLERLQPANYSGVFVVCEWYDLDPRLGFRRLGGWAPSSFDDILSSVEAALRRLRAAVERLAESVTVALALPTLPPAPLEIAPPPRMAHLEPRLWAGAWAFAEFCAALPGVRLLNPEELDRRSPHPQRFDLGSELSHGCPYRVTHASALAEVMTELMAPPAPLKGLITDLDDTLWRGIVGETGSTGIAFTQETGAQIHGLYQQILQSLAERGVLLAVASKNDPSVVEEALARADLAVARDSFFPVEAHWGQKSESVARILKGWNIAADAVLFVDDNPMELAEVQARFPEIHCHRFPKDDAEGLAALFETLRHSFGKPTILEEDRLRSRSLRSQAAIESPEGDAALREEFLAGLDAHLAFQVSRDARDERAFELINKTNQFNLNGRRLTEADWREALSKPGAFLMTASYRDKFGPLGKVAVVLGDCTGEVATVHSWVMSCRAFSRRIEHATLQQLFERLNVKTIRLEFQATERNGPLREFMKDAGVPEAFAEISAAEFQHRCPRLSHTIEEAAHAGR